MKILKTNALPTSHTITRICLPVMIIAVGMLGSVDTALAGSAPLSKDRIYTVTDNNRLGLLGPGGRAAFALRCDDSNDVALSVSCDVENGDPFPVVSITRQALYNDEDGRSVGICGWYTPREAPQAYDLRMSMECLTIKGKK